MISIFHVETADTLYSGNYSSTLYSGTLDPQNKSCDGLAWAPAMLFGDLTPPTKKPRPQHHKVGKCSKHTLSPYSCFSNLGVVLFVLVVRAILLWGLSKDPSSYQPCNIPTPRLPYLNPGAANIQVRRRRKVGLRPRKRNRKPPGTPQVSIAAWRRKVFNTVLILCQCICI